MEIPLLNKEDILPRIPREKRLFAGMIKFLEQGPPEEGGFKLMLFGIFVKGVTDASYKYAPAINEAIENFPEDKLSFGLVYELGVYYSLDLMHDTIPYILNLSKDDDIRESLYYKYMEGIENATHAYVNGVDISDTLKVIEQINLILTENEDKPQEELWQDIKNNIFGSEYLRLTEGKIV
jgi:hypothetical protein